MQQNAISDVVSKTKWTREQSKGRTEICQYFFIYMIQSVEMSFRNLEKL